VSSRPHIGLRKINTSLEADISKTTGLTPIPFWDKRVGVGCFGQQGISAKKAKKPLLCVI
jgi:hypothetical protein